MLIGKKLNEKKKLKWRGKRSEKTLFVAIVFALPALVSVNKKAEVPEINPIKPEIYPFQT